MAASVTIKQLLEAGVHFGHQTRRWNPKMEPYIFGERNGIHIIDLRQTLEQVQAAYAAVLDVTSKGGTVLFVGTKKQAQHPIIDAAERARMPYIANRWLGGMLTNFHTTHKRVLYMRELERMDTSGEMDSLPKKERIRLRREMAKLQNNLGGVRDLARPPEMLFLVDVNNELIAVKEATKLKIPIVAVVDTNCDPDPISIVIPGNDDAIRATQLMAGAIADACIEGSAAHAKGVEAAAQAADARKDEVAAEQEAAEVERERQNQIAREAAAAAEAATEAALAGADAPVGTDSSG
ncbi:MAG: 30S ribosomal protein S2 [Acidimicrobiia bacterium]|nr:30S ribosomal protein S2 [Acidimicrobiia bacterium]MBT8249166.1 30S ribosomal protein S2 [Acidimicrobiia bacterium]NNC43828.1 30S ribosomal protein S2 [Acidimicrobiia bacterium]NND12760.1 30S ribosomal protein S2 [Acidimicrobiia bacterium]NNL27338.1 30S ribosomal protein S2 [Acidimicrobiia bacterium]